MAYTFVIKAHESSHSRRHFCQTYFEGKKKTPGNGDVQHTPSFLKRVTFRDCGGLLAVTWSTAYRCSIAEQPGKPWACRRHAPPCVTLPPAEQTSHVHLTINIIFDLAQEALAPGLGLHAEDNAFTFLQHSG